MNDDLRADQVGAAPSGMLVEALSRENGKNATIRVFPDRIEWIKAESISSLPRSKDEPPVIPMGTVRSVKARKDGPLFSKLVLRTETATFVFRMYSPQAVEVRDTIGGLLAAGPVASPPAGNAAPLEPAAPATTPDELLQLESLRDDGILSPEEFEAAKAQLGAN